ncbi:DUF4142 domain-containing protein [Sphingomonas dokdonensis]|uniref:DUF4142 domain-containing protein n=1 Tax=Sphingomonas dokdonensis TaxID=344880 RepID=A0A245ZNB9_9SPHN|nr:DUF4142 domain-containing protein [Sphingomonas dokdonensis]OWK31244.1 hypothetical protein SPDO_12510 [Sphingomonas dokdonensis]
MKALPSFAIVASIMVAGPALAQATSPADYVAKAGAGDLYERTSSQLVMGSTKNPKVRQFAQMMITDHTKSTNEVKAAAKQAGITPQPPALMPDQTRMIAELRAAPAATRDQVYLTQQKAAHQKALALHKSYAQTGTAAPLKMVAGKVAPVVQHHIDMLNRM